MNQSGPEWKTPEPFEVNAETGSERLEFEFEGHSQHPVSLDPAEFKGMDSLKISSSILQIMSAIAPGVSFYTEDFDLAADAVQAANGERAPAIDE